MLKSNYLKLYQKIQACRQCSTVNSEKALRKLETVNFGSKIMLIAEAMAPSQVRVSGVNYFDINGKIGNTGLMLEKFLSKFGYSVYPNNPNCIYHTEIVHCFPGYSQRKDKKFIRRPTNDEINGCLNNNFLQEEIDLLKPKLIFLMGKTSYETFYKYFLGYKAKEITNLTKKIEEISESGVYDEYNGIPLIPIQHSSGANPNFHKMLKDEKLVKLVKNLIKKDGQYISK